MRVACTKSFCYQIFSSQENDGEESKEIDVGNEEDNVAAPAEVAASLVEVGTRKKRKPLKVNGILKAAATAVEKQ